MFTFHACMLGPHLLRAIRASDCKSTERNYGTVPQGRLCVFSVYKGVFVLIAHNKFTVNQPPSTTSSSVGYQA